ncbi:MAG: glycosyltransferase [Chroococcidiopsidaceae cyanobacterium CP_BM_RX_35]|nr:glycosyltransferase [Chroococcidiopsidaceae cyanobacterium CP_BM_RX_35]
MFAALSGMKGNFLSGFGKSISLLLKKVTARIEYMKCFRVVSLKPEQPSQGNVLLSYRIEPFFFKSGKSLPNDHTWYWECRQIAQTFLDLGYCVDVIQFHNYKFVPKKDYAFFIDIRHRLEQLSPLLNKDCIKILHSDTAHILFHNYAEQKRLLALQQRKGITLKPQRFEMPNVAIEYADCMTLLGNEFTIDTFKYAKKPIYRIPISSPKVYSWPKEKNFESCRKSFLWFGSGGLVHKGLDLVLDAFAEMPEYHLTICGPVSKEKDFEKAFYKELYATPNIHMYGWINISSPQFIEIANSCVGIIYPSCSEGGGGCVITCMHAGLIPIVSYESSVDVRDDFGMILKESSIEEIKNSIQMISSLPASELKNMSRKAWEFARANHTREKFAESYRNTVGEIISNHRKTNIVGIVSTSENFTDNNVLEGACT